MTEGAWRESFSRLAASRLDARASVHSPRKKRDYTQSNRFINKQFPALGKTSLTIEKKIRQILGAIHAVSFSPPYVRRQKVALLAE